VIVLSSRGIVFSSDAEESGATELGKKILCGLSAFFLEKSGIVLSVPPAIPADTSFIDESPAARRDCVQTSKLPQVFVDQLSFS